MKAILVIDKPSSCIECRYSLFGGCYCTLIQEDLIVKDGDISENCPLKPMPEFRDEHYKSFNIELSQIINSENRGYNDCLREILGEQE